MTDQHAPQVVQPTDGVEAEFSSPIVVTPVAVPRSRGRPRKSSSVEKTPKRLKASSKNKTRSRSASGRAAGRSSVKVHPGISSCVVKDARGSGDFILSDFNAEHWKYPEVRLERISHDDITSCLPSDKALGYESQASFPDLLGVGDYRFPVSPCLSNVETPACFSDDGYATPTLSDINQNPYIDHEHNDKKSDNFKGFCHNSDKSFYSHDFNSLSPFYSPDRNVFDTFLSRFKSPTGPRVLVKENFHPQDLSALQVHQPTRYVSLDDYVFDENSLSESFGFTDFTNPAKSHHVAVNSFTLADFSNCKYVPVGCEHFYGIVKDIQRHTGLNLTPVLSIEKLKVDNNSVAYLQLQKHGGRPRLKQTARKSFLGRPETVRPTGIKTVQAKTGTRLTKDVGRVPAIEKPARHKVGKSSDTNEQPKVSKIVDSNVKIPKSYSQSVSIGSDDYLDDIVGEEDFEPDYEEEDHDRENQEDERDFHLDFDVEVPKPQEKVVQLEEPIESTTELRKLVPLEAVESTTEPVTVVPVCEPIKPTTKPVKVIPLGDAIKHTTEAVKVVPVCEPIKPTTEPVKVVPLGEAVKHTTESVKVVPLSKAVRHTTKPLKGVPLGDTIKHTTEAVKVVPVCEPIKPTTEPVKVVPLGEAVKHTTESVKVVPLSKAVRHTTKPLKVVPLGDTIKHTTEAVKVVPVCEPIKPTTEPVKVVPLGEAVKHTTESVKVVPLSKAVRHTTKPLKVVPLREAVKHTTEAVKVVPVCEPIKPTTKPVKVVSLGQAVKHTPEALKVVPLSEPIKPATEPVKVVPLQQPVLDVPSKNRTLTVKLGLPVKAIKTVGNSKDHFSAEDMMKAEKTLTVKNPAWFDQLISGGTYSKPNNVGNVVKKDSVNKPKVKSRRSSKCVSKDEHVVVAAVPDEAAVSLKDISTKRDGRRKSLKFDDVSVGPGLTKPESTNTRHKDVPKRSRNTSLKRDSLTVTHQEVHTVPTLSRHDTVKRERTPTPDNNEEYEDYGSSSVLGNPVSTVKSSKPKRSLSVDHIRAVSTSAGHKDVKSKPKKRDGKKLEKQTCGDSVMPNASPNTERKKEVVRAISKKIAEGNLLGTVGRHSHAAPIEAGNVDIGDDVVGYDQAVVRKVTPPTVHMKDVVHRGTNTGQVNYRQDVIKAKVEEIDSISMSFSTVGIQTLPAQKDVSVATHSVSRKNKSKTSLEITPTDSKEHGKANVFRKSTLENKPDSEMADHGIRRHWKANTIVPSVCESEFKSEERSTSNRQVIKKLTLKRHSSGSQRSESYVPPSQKSARLSKSDTQICGKSSSATQSDTEMDNSGGKKMRRSPVRAPSHSDKLTSSEMLDKSKMKQGVVKLPGPSAKAVEKEVFDTKTPSFVDEISSDNSSSIRAQIFIEKFDKCIQDQKRQISEPPDIVKQHVRPMKKTDHLNQDRDLVFRNEQQSNASVDASVSSYVQHVLQKASDLQHNRGAEKLHVHASPSSVKMTIRMPDVTNYETKPQDYKADQKLIEAAPDTSNSSNDKEAIHEEDPFTLDIECDDDMFPEDDQPGREEYEPKSKCDEKPAEWVGPDRFIPNDYGHRTGERLSDQRKESEHSNDQYTGWTHKQSGDESSQHHHRRDLDRMSPENFEAQLATRQLNASDTFGRRSRSRSPSNEHRSSRRSRFSEDVTSMSPAGPSRSPERHSRSRSPVRWCRSPSSRSGSPDRSRSPVRSNTGDQYMESDNTSQQQELENENNSFERLVHTCTFYLLLIFFCRLQPLYSCLAGEANHNAGSSDASIYIFIYENKVYFMFS